MSGKNSRLGSRDHAKGGLTEEMAEKIEEREHTCVGRDKELSQGAYFKSGIKRNPLLVIYPVELAVKPNEPDTHSILPPSATFARFVFRLYIFFDQFSIVE